MRPSACYEFDRSYYLVLSGGHNRPVSQTKGLPSCFSWISTQISTCTSEWFLIKGKDSLDIPVKRSLVCLKAHFLSTCYSICYCRKWSLYALFAKTFFFFFCKKYTELCINKTICKFYGCRICGVYFLTYIHKALWLEECNTIHL